MIRIIHRNWWIILLTPILAVVIVLFIDSKAPTRYQSRTRLFISSDFNLVEGRDLIYSYSTLDEASIVATFVEITTSRRIFVDAVAALALPPDLSEDYYISAVTLPNTSVVELTVEGPNPELVQALANAVGVKTNEFIKSHYEGYNLEFLDPPILPRVPYQPSPQKDAAITGALGLVVGILLAALREMIERPFDSNQQRAAQDPISMALKRSYLIEAIDHYSDPRNGFVTVAIFRFNGMEHLKHSLPASAYRRLLRQIASILRAELRGKDLVAYWNATSFAVLMPNTSSSEAARLLERVQHELSQPLPIYDGEETVKVYPQVGATYYRSNELTPEALVHAEKALEKAGGNSSRPVFYMPETFDDQTMPVNV